jgi:branched-chain amino acid transport system substrate-binding protein
MKKNYLFILIIAGVAIIVALFYFINSSKATSSINIASLITLDGSTADMGEMLRNGQILAMEEINAKAKRKEDSVNIYFFNTSLKKDIALDKMKEANGKGIKFIAEIMGSDLAEHCFDYALQNNLFILSGVDTKPDLVEKGKGSFFRIMPSDAAASKIILNWANNLSLKRITVLFANDAWGTGLKNAAIKNAKEYNLEIIDSRDVIKNQPSFAAIVSQLKTSQPDGVCLFLYSDDGGRFLKEAQRQGLKAKFFATENFTGTKVVDNAKDAVEGVMMVVPSSSEQTALLETFTRKYKNRFNVEPTIFSIKGYDEVNVIYDIMKKSKSNVQQAKLLMKSYTGNGVSGRFSFDGSGEFVPGKYDRMVFVKVKDTYEPKVTEK